MQAGSCRITDLGLCGPVDDESSRKIYGIIPYISPEVLQGGKNTKESDIYSIGMLMWEIFAGHPSFDDRDHDYHLILQICEGLRPQILPEMPDDYVQMMQKCWDADPFKRPTIKELRKFSRSKLKEFYKNEKNQKYVIDYNNSNISSGSNSNSPPQQVHKAHPLAYHTSRILDDEIAKSKSLKSNDSLLSDLDVNSVL